MTPILYTDTDAVRAALGVNEREVSDSQIVNLQVADHISLELVEVYPTHETLKAAIDANSATVEEKLTFKRLRLYCQYEAAVMMLPSLQMWAFQRVSDGDAEAHRFLPEDIDKTVERITGMRDKYKAQLNPELMADANFAALVLVAVSPDRDIIEDA